MVMGLYHDFSVIARTDGRLEIRNPPPPGALCGFSLELLAQLNPAHFSTDPDGRLVIHVIQRSLVGIGRPFRPVTYTFEPVRFDPHNVSGGPPRILACRRVEP